MRVRGHIRPKGSEMKKFPVVDEWGEKNGHDCVNLMVDVLNAFDAFMHAQDNRLHVDNPAWLALVNECHALRVFLHDAQEYGKP